MSLKINITFQIEKTKEEFKQTIKNTKVNTDVPKKISISQFTNRLEIQNAKRIFRQLKSYNWG